MKIDEAKILISDDSILARKQLKDIISSLGTPTFVEASNGQAAIDKYKEEKPDLGIRSEGRDHHRIFCRHTVPAEMCIGGGR